MKNTKTNFAKKGNRNKTVYIILAILLLLVFLEFSFHLFEIALGKLLLVTNSRRSQIGTMWEEEQKDLSGDIAADSLLKQHTASDSLYTRQITSIFDLHAELMLRKRLVMDHKSFMNFYLSIPSKTAKSIFTPMKLLELEKNLSWESVEFTLNDDQITLLFKNGFNEILQENYIDVNRLLGGHSNREQTSLAQTPAFKDRIVPANMFFSAYLALPNLQRLQIMNDPYLLLYWGDDLLNVGIESKSDNGTVVMAFEVMSDYKIRIHTVNASKMAVEYLISTINKQAGYHLIGMPG